MGQVPLPPPPCRVPNPLSPSGVFSQGPRAAASPLCFSIPPPHQLLALLLSPGQGCSPGLFGLARKIPPSGTTLSPLLLPAKGISPAGGREGGREGQAGRPPPETQNGVLVWWGRWSFTQGAQREKAEGLQFPTSLSTFGACSPVLSSNPEWPGRCPLL